MGLLAFLLSLAMLLQASRAVSRRVSAEADERFWIQIATAALLIGTTSLILTALHRLTPPMFLATEALLVLALGAILARYPRLDGRAPFLRRINAAKRFAGSSRVHLLLMIAIALLIALTGVERFVQPVFGFDDRMYHASRAAYWMQHQSLLAWETHNDRQIMFPLGAELLFFWPLLFTRAEWPAMLVFWLAYPLTARGIYLTLRRMGQGERTSLAGSLVYCATPIILYHTNRVHPDLWTTVFCLGCAFWVIRAAQRALHVDEARPALRAMFWCGMFAALAVNTRSTALPILIASIFVAPWLIGLGARGGLRSGASALVGAALGLLLSGSICVFVQNTIRNGNPLGSAAIRETHTADVSLKQLRTHAVRFGLTLVDLPMTPEPLRRAIENGKQRAAGMLGAATPLKLEARGDWPGPQVPQMRPQSAHYSIAGWVLLPAIVVVVGQGIIDLRRSVPRPRLRSEALAAVLALPMLVAGVFLVRWMDGIERFWISAFALSLLFICPMCAAIVKTHRILKAVAWMALSAFSIAAGVYRFRSDQSGFVGQRSPVGLDEPFFEPFAHIPDGSTILLFIHGDGRDYPLFNPRGGFTDRLVCWGKRSLDSNRLSKQLLTGRQQGIAAKDLPAEARVTHVLFQDDRALEFHWDGTLAMAPFVAWMRQQRDFIEVPLPYTPHMRLFQRRDLPSLPVGE